MRPLEHLLVAGAAVIVVACGCGWYTHSLKNRLRVLDDRLGTLQSQVQQRATGPEMAQLERLRVRVRALNELEAMEKNLSPHRRAQASLFQFLKQYSLTELTFEGAAHVTERGPRLKASQGRQRKLPGVIKVIPVPGGLELTLQ